MKEIFERYSPRAFDKSKQISDKDIKLILEAASWAPSSFNNQPWRFFVSDKRKNDNFYNEILSALNEFNQKWAVTAPILIVLTCLKHYEHNLKQNTTAMFELGLAVQNMIIKAMNVGIYSHIMGGFDKEKIRKVINADENLEVVAILALGYLGKIDDLPDEIKKAEIEKKRIRKNLNEIVFESSLK
jgi:nitroreductase